MVGFRNGAPDNLDSSILISILYSKIKRLTIGGAAPAGSRRCATYGP
jgi:hypothetical protein